MFYVYEGWDFVRIEERHLVLVFHMVLVYSPSV